MNIKAISTITLGLGMLLASCSPKEPDLPTETKQEVPKVYFTRELTPEALVKMYQLVNQEMIGKVAIKLHTGEKNGPNIIPRDMVKALQATIPNSTIVETNTLYDGDRYTTEEHLETIKVNGWDFCPVDIMDSEGTVNLPVNGGKHFKEVSMGGHIVNYDSMLVLTHFKGHGMGGFGGSIKNIAIGCADGRVGKAQVHQGGTGKNIMGAAFMENMVESAKATCDHFGKHITFVNVLRNMSVDCDCAGVNAAPVKCRDIGILASTDIVAIDQASVDLVDTLPAEEKHDLQERIKSREGMRQVEYGEEMGLGSRKYELIEVK